MGGGESSIFWNIRIFFGVNFVIFLSLGLNNDTFLIQNHILLLFKLYIYNARKHGFLSFNNFLNEVSKIKTLEKRVAENNRNKCERFRKKWHRIENEVP